MKLLRQIILPVVLFLSSFNAFAGGSEGGEFNVGEMIFHHIADAHDWHLAGDFAVPLPVILWSPEKGLDVFLSSEFHHGENIVNGYGYHHGEVYMVGENGEHLHPASFPDLFGGHMTYIDFSITKNVASMLVSLIVLLLVFSAVAKGYKKNSGKAPSGIQSFLEPVIMFVRDDVVSPMLGNRTDKYLPYCLTVFFFIWVNNLLGLLPGAANVTGNIAVTATLAILTFIVTNVSGNKHYWEHIFATPGVPKPVLPILVPVEIIGMFTKPFSLAVRLFANISAGHIIILSIISMIFIFKNIFGAGAGFGSTAVAVPFGIFMYCLELLVAVLQAYIFTMLTALFISQATEEVHH